MTSSKPRRFGRLLHAARGGLLTLATACAMWLALIIHPQPLFAYSLHRENIVLHAREPLPPRAGPILDDVVRRVSRSPLYDPRRTHDVFLCGTSSLFTFLSFTGKGAGLTNPWGNVFIRPANVAHDRVIDRSGHERFGERTLAYVIAHEVTHAMTLRHLGYSGFRRLAPFQKEGYADYVALARPVDLRAGREALRRNDPEMNTHRSGLYKRYELLTAYLLDRRGWSVDALLARPLDQRAIERELDRDDLDQE